MPREAPKTIGQWKLPCTATLTDAIEDTYRVFARYEVPSKLDAPEHREPVQLRAELTGVPLRQLDSKLFGAYAGWAMTTVDGPDTYRHFLPRIFEMGLEHRPHMGFEPSVIAGKLDYGHWRSWPSEEQEVIARFFQVAWEHTLLDEHHHPDWFQGIARAGLNVDQALHYWQQSNSQHALLKAAYMIGFEVGRVAGEIVVEGAYWDEIEIGLRRRITTWLLEPAMRTRIAAMMSELDPESEEHWILQQGIATWDRLTSVQEPAARE